MNRLFSSSWLFLVVFIITALIMTIYEWIKEVIFKGTLTPWESHTITIIVTAAIATVTASVMRSWMLKIIIKQKELEAKEQSLASFELILSAVNHIVGNVLNYFQVIKFEVEDEGTVKEETLNMLEESIRESENQIRLLNKIKAPSDPKSYKGIYPE